VDVDISINIHVKSMDMSMDMDLVYQWSTWQLQISSQKCCVIDVSKSTAADAGYRCRLGSEGLTTSENVCDLGVVVDSHLCFSEHIAIVLLARRTKRPT